MRLICLLAALLVHVLGFGQFMICQDSSQASSVEWIPSNLNHSLLLNGAVSHDQIDSKAWSCWNGVASSLLPSSGVQKLNGLSQDFPAVVIEPKSSHLISPRSFATTADGSSVALADTDDVDGGCNVPIACNYDPEATGSNCDYSCWTENLLMSLEYNELGYELCADTTACNYNAEVETPVNGFCLYDMESLSSLHGWEDNGSNAWLIAPIPMSSSAILSPQDEAFLAPLLDRAQLFSDAGGNVCWVGYDTDGWLLELIGADPQSLDSFYAWSEGILPGQVVFNDLVSLHLRMHSGSGYGLWGGCGSTCFSEMEGAVLEWEDGLDWPVEEVMGLIVECCSGDDCPSFNCGDPVACNYTPSDLIDNDLCVYSEDCGCMDEFACNFNPDASEAGYCDTSCLGCTDFSACNFNPESTVDDGSCAYSESCGCMNDAACNFDPVAIEEGWCDLTSCVGCVNPDACDYDPDATISAPCDLPFLDLLSQWYFWDGTPISEHADDLEGKVLLIEFGGTWCAPCLEARLQGASESLLAETGPSGSDEARIIHFIQGGFDFDTFENYYLSNAVEGEYFVILEEAAVTLMTLYGVSQIPSIYSACPGQCTSSAWSSTIQGVQPMDLTTLYDGIQAGCIPGCMDANACNFSGEGTYSAGCEYSVECGCMDPSACDYDPQSTVPTSCDYETCASCTNPFAFNYDPDATNSNNETCELPALNAYNTSCDDPEACNYSEELEYDNNTWCLYTVEHYLEMATESSQMEDQAWMISALPPYDPALVDSDSDVYEELLALDLHNPLQWFDSSFVANGGGILWVGVEPDGWLLGNAQEGQEFHATFQEPWMESLPGTFILDDVLYVHLLHLTQTSYPRLGGCSGDCMSSLVGVGYPFNEYAGGLLSMPFYETANLITGCCFGEDCPVITCADTEACNFDPQSFFVEFEPDLCEYGSCGCQDPEACNYDDEAEEPAWCDYMSCLGCTDPTVCNYDAFATIDDGSCDIHCGCMEAAACNYNPAATSPGPCDYRVLDAIGDWTTHDGAPLSFYADDLEGKKIIFETGATWCTPCWDSRDYGASSYILSEFGPEGSDEVRIIHIMDMTDFSLEGFEQGWLDLAVPGEYFITDQLAISFLFEAYQEVVLSLPSLFSACADQCVGELQNADLQGEGFFTYNQEYPVDEGVMASIQNMSCPALGCMDESACNYSAEADLSDGSCVYDEGCGCTDESACNYDSFASIPSWCDYTSCAGCTQPTACNYSALATIDDGGCVNGVTDLMSSWSLWSGEPLDGMLSEFDDKILVFEHSATGCAGCIESRQTGHVQNLLDQYGPNGSDVLRVIHVIDAWDWNYLTFSEHWLSSMVSGEYFILADFETQGPLIEYLNLSGETDVNGEGGNDFDWATLYALCELECGDGLAVPGVSSLDEEAVFSLAELGPCAGGCTDPVSCTFDFSASLDDGSCLYADAMGVCGGSCVSDTDEDGICDLEDNCTALNACNFLDPNNAACEYLDDCGVCGGLGPVHACGCADIPEGDCDCNGGQVDAIGVCDGTCVADLNNNGICDSEEGCTYVGASNFEVDANFDDGSCTFTDDCSGDLTSDGFVGINDLLLLLSQFATECN